MDTGVAGGRATISRVALQTLLDVLTSENYEVLGPTVRDGAIVYDEITRLADLPSGWTDHQDAGRYRLERRDDEALFGFAVGPQVVEALSASADRDACGRRAQGDDGVTVDERCRHRAANLPLSAFAPANSTRSPSRIACSREGPYPDLATRCAAGAPSSSP